MKISRMPLPHPLPKGKGVPYLDSVHMARVGRGCEDPRAIWGKNGLCDCALGIDVRRRVVDAEDPAAVAGVEYQYVAVADWLRMRLPSGENSAQTTPAVSGKEERAPIAGVSHNGVAARPGRQEPGAIRREGRYRGVERFISGKAGHRFLTCQTPVSVCRHIRMLYRPRRHPRYPVSKDWFHELKRLSYVDTRNMKRSQKQRLI